TRFSRDWSSDVCSSDLFISDGTGITAETLGHSLLAQFDSIDFEQITIPYVNTESRALDAIARINKAAAADGHQPIVFDTIVNEEIGRASSRAREYSARD